MPHHVHIFTYKTGLLSRVAHDLRLRPERFSIRVEDDRVHAEFDAASLRVDGVMRSGQLRASELSARDRAKIHATIESEILVARAHPKILFSGTLSLEPLAASGTLTLKGRQLQLAVRARRVDARVHASVELQPSRFGIPPYRALGGAIRLQDRVTIALDLDAAVLDPALPEGPPM